MSPSDQEFLDKLKHALTLTEDYIKEQGYSEEEKQAIAREMDIFLLKAIIYLKTSPEIRDFLWKSKKKIHNLLVGEDTDDKHRGTD